MPPIGGDTTLALGYKLNSVPRGFKQSSLLMSLPFSIFLNIDFIIIHKVKEPNQKKKKRKEKS